MNTVQNKITFIEQIVFICVLVSTWLRVNQECKQEIAYEFCLAPIYLSHLPGQTRTNHTSIYLGLVSFYCGYLLNFAEDMLRHVKN